MTIHGRALAVAAIGADRLFVARQAENRAPSAAFGIFTREGLIHTGATGEVDGHAPTADTIYRIASCTKSFTATALLALRDQGTITLDDPVTDYVPAFCDVRLPTSDSPTPTVRMLMTMSAGLPTDDPWGDRQEAISDADFDALLSRGLRFDSVPGTRFAYSNLGYALLGRVISVASGRPYRDHVTATILEPLDLASTTFVKPVDSDDQLAVGHRRIDDGWEPLPFSGPGGFSAIGGLFSTVNDLSRWARWLASAFDPGDVGGDARTPAKGTDIDGDEVLSRASRRELQQLNRFVPALSTVQPAGYGFGLFVEEHTALGTVVSHSGGYPGFSAHMRWHPESGIGIIAFENATYAQVAVPASTALHGLLEELGRDGRLRSAPTVWPETAAARQLVEAALRGAELRAECLSENVELDLPLARRRDQWAAAIAEIGGLGDPPIDGPGLADPESATAVSISPESGDESGAPSHLVWRLSGAHGRLRVEIRLTPEARPRIQTLTVRAEGL